MTEPSLQGDRKWPSFVDGGDGFLYGIPCNARRVRVVKFNPLDKSLAEIGPDLGDGGDKWLRGVRANNGRIYCAPYRSNHILKIDPIQGTVETPSGATRDQYILLWWLVGIRGTCSRQ